MGNSAVPAGRTVPENLQPGNYRGSSKENKLSTEYNQLIASAKIPFEGEERTLPQLHPFELSTDRSMRERASEARYTFMAEHEAEFDRIYDELVKVRTQIAKN